MPPLTGRIAFTLLGILFHFGQGLPILCAQESLKSSSKSAADLKELAIKEQIRQVKRRLDTLGPKHPSWAMTNKRLEDLEKELAKLRGVEQPPPTPSNPVELDRPREAPPPRKDSDRQAVPIPKKEKPSPMMTELEIIDPIDRWVGATLARHRGAPYEGYRKAPAIVAYAEKALDPWIPLIEPSITRGITHMGRMFEAGQYWGLEIDTETQCSRVWIIQSDASIHRKTLLWQTPGVLQAIHFSEGFSTTGTWYAVREQASSPKEVELIEIQQSGLQGLSNPNIKETLLATITPDRRAMSRPSMKYQFGEYTGGVFFVFSRNSFQLKPRTDPARCIALDPTVSIFWSESKSPTMKDIRKKWLELSRSIDAEGQIVTLSKDLAVWIVQDATGRNRLYAKEPANRLAKEIAIIPGDNPSLFKLSSPSDLNIIVSKGTKLAYWFGILNSIWSNRIDSVRTDLTPQKVFDTSKKMNAVFLDHEDHVLVLIDQVVYSLEGLVRSKANTNADQLIQNRFLANSGLGKISNTGIFADLESQRLREYFFEYELRGSKTVHGNEARYFMAVPEGKAVDRKSEADWDFPNGTVFVQASKSKQDDTLRLLVKSQGRWMGFVYRWLPGKQDAFLVSTNGDLAIDGNFVDVDGTSGKNIMVPKWESEGACWRCHLSDQNDGVLGFSRQGLANVSSDGLLQFEFLKLGGLFGKKSVISQIMDRGTRDRMVDSLERLKRLTPGFADQVLQEHSEIETLLSAYLITGDIRLNERLRSTYRVESIQQSLLTPNQYDISSRLSGIQQGLLLSLIDDSQLLKTTVGQAAMILNESKSEIEGLEDKTRQVDLACRTANILFDLYETRGANWARDDALKQVETINRILDGKSSLDEWATSELARACFVNIRATELTKDGLYLERVKLFWEKLRSIPIGTRRDDVLIIALINRCILRSLDCDFELDEPDRLLYWVEAFCDLLERSSSKLANFGDGAFDSLGYPEIFAISEALLESVGIVPRLLLWTNSAN